MSSLEQTLPRLKKVRSFIPDNTWVFAPYTFAFSWVVYAALYFPKLNKITLYPDSDSYIHNDTTRGFIYPFFVDLLIPKSVQALPWPVSAEEFLALSSNYSVIAYVQWALFVTLSFLLMRLLYKKHFLGPVLFLGLVAGHQFFFPNAFLTGNIKAYLSFVLTEGLGYSWVLGLALLTFFNCQKSKLKMSLAVLMGVYCYLGIEIAPRMVAFSGIGVLVPLLVGLFHSKWASKVRALTPITVFFILVLLRCSYNKAHFDVFAPTPFGGQSLTGVAIQFAGQEDHTLLQEPKAREYAYRILHHPQRSKEAYKNTFINRNIYGIGYETYKEMAKENKWSDNLASYNAFVVPVINKLFYKNPPAVARWWDWFTTQLKDLWNSNAYFTPLHILSLLFSLALIVLTKAKNRVILASPLLLLLPLASLCLTAGIQGVDFRYLSTGELLLPVVLSFLAVETIALLTNVEKVEKT